MFDLQNNIDYVVIGDPVAHSLSPEMQNAGFEAIGLGSPYGKLHVKAENFPEFINFARQNLKGFNITVPHKHRIIPYLDSISREADLTSSVNTVIINSGKMHGCSTDGFGLQTALKEAFDFELFEGNVLFIGCGGAVQAVAFHFAANGAKNLFFANRTLSKAQDISFKIRENYPECECFSCALNDEAELKYFIDKSMVVVQGTSLGLHDGDPMPINPDLLNNICYYDTIYKETPLLRVVKQAGLPASDGRTMLLHQGAKSFELWTGKKAPVKKMRQALYEAIERKKRE